MLSQLEIHEKLIRLGDKLENATVDLMRAINEAAEADAAYKRAYLVAHAKSQSPSAVSRDRDAEAAAINEYQAKVFAEGNVKRATEYTRSLRVLIDMYRTLAADYRVQV